MCGTFKANHLAPKLKRPGTYIYHKKSTIHGSVKWDPSWVPGDPSWNPSPGAHWHPGRGSYPMHTPKKKNTKNFRYLKWMYSPVKAVCKADVRQTSPPKQRYKVHRWSLWLFVHFFVCHMICYNYQRSLFKNVLKFCKSLKKALKLTCQRFCV